LYASQVRDSLGLAVDRVLKRIDENGELSHVIWECEYSSEEERKEDVRKLTESGAFEKVIKKMGTLIDKFTRGVYKVN
jgi:G:T-mismatch repair DNA endonuclease (very short patch repair protein)